jgi:hypothetical protein
MTSAITSPELALLRSEGQFAELYLAIYKPPVVWQAQINQMFGAVGTSLDSVNQIIFNNSSGTAGHVIAGMTLYVGTTAGAWDVGIIRVRRRPDSEAGIDVANTKIYVGETSEIQFANYQYLTVVDEFNLWAKHVRMVGTSVYMDYDFQYVDQHSKPQPLVNIGPNPVLWLTDTTVTYSPDASNSWVLPGYHNTTTITAYLWDAPGSSALTGNTTATPTITYNAAGVYRIACKVTTSDGAFHTGYRYVFVYSAASMPITDFQLTNLTGDAQSGGWNFDVTLYDQAALSDVRERALVILFAKTYYNGTEQYFGPVSGCENIIAEGYIEPASVIDNPEQGSCSFHVQSPAYFLKNIDGFPSGLEQYKSSGSKYLSVAGDGLNWLTFLSLTVDECVWHFLHWRSTATLMMDIFPTGDTRTMEAINPPAGNLWQQLDQMCNKTILAAPLVNRFGQLIMAIDAQYTPLNDRTAIPVVMDVTQPDWTGDVEITVSPFPACSMLDISGISFAGNYYLSGTTHLEDTASPLFSRSPGNVYKYMGSSQPIDNLLFVDQDQANYLCGLIMGQLNNDTPTVSISLAGINLMCDITPPQYVTMSISTGDTPRAINWTGKKLLPRRFTVSYNGGTGYFAITIECEGETFPENAITILHPIVAPPTPPDGGGGGGGGGPIGGDFPPFPPPVVIFPPNPPPPLLDCINDQYAAGNGAFGMFPDRYNLDADNTSAIIWYPCAVRMGSANSPTVINMIGSMFNSTDNGATWEENETDAAVQLSIDAIDTTGSVLIPSTLEQDYQNFRAGFAPTAGTDVDGFKITLNPDGGSLGTESSFTVAGGYECVKSGVPGSTFGSISYNGGVFTCTSPDPTHDYDFELWAAMELQYTGASLPYGNIRITLTNTSGSCTDVWSDLAGYHFSTMQNDWNGDGTHPVWGYSSTGDGPFTLGTQIQFTGIGGGFTPSTSESRYLYIRFGFRRILTLCTFRIDSIDWVTDGGTIIAANLWPGEGYIPITLKFAIQSINISNICSHS